MNGLNLQQMMAMMQQGQGDSSDAASSLQELCSFKAGRCQASPLGDGSLKITPMKGKGLLKLTRTTSSHSEGEGMIHLSWEDRKTKETPDKFIIFPSEAKFEKIETPNEEDTPVCMLSYNGNSDRRNFYWVQELEFDKENINEINTLMNDPAKAKKKADPEGAETSESAPASATASPTSGANPTAGTSDTSMDVVSNNDIISSANLPADTSAVVDPPANPTTTTPAANASGAVDVQNLQSILSGLGLPAASSSPSPTASLSTPAAPSKSGGITLSDLQSAMSRAQEGESKLSDYVTFSEVERQGILDDSTVVDKLTSLLPEGQRTKDSLITTLRSPQVLSALTSLTSALNGPEFSSVLANFDLEMGEEEQRLVAEGKGVEAFIRACEKKARESK
ncbi:hypothetical protein TrST_g7518 [Triparma strigata]|uniref:Adhesion regulating molecule 1 n=1 Tax=Triparma strigata TaxID=1606541 RepID=A0A9W7DXV8_9STRA|nr:hypothetical protein TrST_g7518 [Triparma strigata]